MDSANWINDWINKQKYLCSDWMYLNQYNNVWCTKIELVEYIYKKQNHKNNTASNAHGIRYLLQNLLQQTSYQISITKSQRLWF